MCERRSAGSNARRLTDHVGRPNPIGVRGEAELLHKLFQLVVGVLTGVAQLDDALHVDVLQREEQSDHSVLARRRGCGARVGEERHELRCELALALRIHERNASKPT